MMDWDRDNAGLSERDLEKVFKYEKKSTTVVRMLVGEKKPMIWSLDGSDEWEEWLQSECPRIDQGSSGLVLVLAKRTGEPSFSSVKKVPSDDWIERISAAVPSRSNTQRTMTFAAAGEKVETMTTSQGANKNGQRSVRTLPFSKDTFRLITTKFYVHSSIARVISRADVPVFSSSKIRMQDENGISHPTYVYNCRTTNAWDMDLALTATYFPHCGLTFVVVFGCSLSVEEEILKRLSFAMAEAAHPLLMPGIFAEIERSRQVHIVEATIDELETRILLLDLQSSDMEGMLESEAEKRNQEKRTAWLDTAYLRNALISWNTQLAKICQHVDRLGSEVFKLTKLTSPSANCKMNLEHNVDRGKDLQEDMERDRTRKGLEDNKEMFQQTGQKIKDRIQGIIDEYDDKIRDCTMRVDGMAMATQWSHGETNVQIALATSRDSRHMRSIAIVTMVFLPGTFFATVFSMTFFNWFGSGGAVVSPYFYIYVLFTVCFTLITLGSWWYFVSYRHSSRQKSSLEEEIPLV